MAALMKMINELGEELREDADKKFALKDSTKGFASLDSVKRLEHDIDSIYLRLKQLENKQIDLVETDQKIVQQVDGQAKNISRHTRDIEELRDLIKKSSSSASSLTTHLVSSKGGDDSGLIELIKKLDEQLRDKSDRSDCKRDHNNLQDQIDTLMARIKKMEDEQKKSNDRIQALEEMVEKLKKEIVNIDAAKIRQELMQLNQMMLNSATKVELQTMNIEVKRAMTGIQDTREDLKLLQQKVAKLEGLLGQLDAECKLEVIKTKENYENLDIQIQALKKQLRSLADRQEAGQKENKSNLMSKTVIGAGDNDDLLRLLQQQLDNLTKQTEKSLKDHQYQLDDKATHKDLVDLEARLRAWILEMLAGLGNQGGKAGDDGLKKRVKDLEAKVSLI